MSEDERDFLRRWSRLKREAVQAPVEKAAEPATPAPALPPIDSLTFESDFKEFMHSKVEQSVKRAALKKLFADPRFNVMDGLDTYIDDYTKADPIPDEMLARLDHARQTLFGPRKDEEEQTHQDGAPSQAESTETAKTDDDPGQDPQAV